MTNGDAIRAMTDEELAEWMDDNIKCVSCWLVDECYGRSCKEMFLGWLRTPTEESEK